MALFEKKTKSQLFFEIDGGEYERDQRFRIFPVRSSKEDTNRNASWSMQSRCAFYWRKDPSPRK